MRRYSASKGRIVLFAVLLIAAALATTSFAQDAAPAGAPGTTKVIEQETFFGLILKAKTDPIFWTIMALSICGMTLIIQGFMQNRAQIFMPDATTEMIREMISQKKFKELIEFTETDPSFISRALNPALKRAPSFSSMKEAMETALGEQTAEQFRKIEYLNIIGNLGPLLGLMGTVVGMIIAFLEMSNSGGNADAGKLANGISKALTHTFLGLMLAVPCLACFGILRTIVDRLTVRGALIAEELLLMVKPAETKPAAARPAGSVPQPAVRKAPPLPVPTPSAG